ncbi:MAG: hypothetical protein ORN28_06600 [Rhodoferax sp.]|nr:hypothetical protein [Rhodoferax sp.]
MTALGLLGHLLNFLAPAAVVGLLVAWVAPFVLKNARVHHSWLAQASINFLSSSSALVAGLWFFGHDGKIASYAFMVLACASSQWLAAKAWRN